MSTLAIDDTEAVEFLHEVVEEYHLLAHSPANPELSHMARPLEECRAAICLRAAQMFVRLDGAASIEREEGARD